MRNSRPSAWAPMGVLVAMLLLSPAATVTVSATVPSRALCQQEFKDYVWNNDLKVPPFVFVLRSSGPNAGHVEKVPFWKYVGTVVRTEYSGSGDRGPIWQRLGALTVKQYAWFYVNQWRGSEAEFSTTDPLTGVVTTTYECYHVKDTTRDQLYKPEQWSTQANAWVPKNTPTPANYVGMRETWHMSMRKWKADKNRSYMFLSGYRSGNSVPCGTDATGFRIYQASLRDCGPTAKNLTLEETLRRYFMSFFFVNTRDHDILSDDATYRGDVGVLVASGGGTRARIYAGNPTDKFGAVTTKDFSFNFGSVVGQGTGNVHTPRWDKDALGNLVEADPNAMFADLFVLTTDKLWLARAKGNGYADPTSTNAAGYQRLLVDDFNGDLLADAGLVGPSGLTVMRSQGGGGFADAASWWSGDLSSRTFVGAGDFNGDGKADLVVRNADKTYETALSRASCTYFATRGLCPAESTGAPGLGDLVAATQTGWDASGVKHVVGDYDRDGRDDLLAVVKDGSSVKVFGLRSLGDGTFASQQVLGSFNLNFDNFTPVALDVSPDSMSDLAMVSANSVVWLRTNERTASPATMTLMPANNSGPGAGFKAF